MFMPGCARQPPVVTTQVQVLTPPPALLGEIDCPPLAGDTNADLARAYLDCLGVVDRHNEDKAALTQWAATAGAAP
jgi:hypothetical protein